MTRSNKPLIKSLRLSKETHMRLSKFARKDETFDDAIARLLDIAEGKKR